MELLVALSPFAVGAFAFALRFVPQLTAFAHSLVFTPQQ
jgi:hypothetical protein